MFFTILPISNTGVSAADILGIVYSLYLKLGSFSDMEYYFWQLAYCDLKVPNRFVGLCSDLIATGANKTTLLHVGTSYTHTIAREINVSVTHQIARAGSLNSKIAGGEGFYHNATDAKLIL